MWKTLLICLTTSVLTACVESQPVSILDPIKPNVAKHAEALAGDDVAVMRKTGLALIDRIVALADW